MTASSISPAYLRRLGVWDGAMIVIGGVIGAGIFRTPATVAERTASGLPLLALWVLGGLLTLTEVVLIALAIGAGHATLLWPVSIGALAALLVVALLGLAVHRPLARVPENTLKFVVGVLLCAFGTYWAGEGVGHAWPGGDWAIPVLALALSGARHREAAR